MGQKLRKKLLRRQRHRRGERRKARLKDIASFPAKKKPHAEHK